MKNNSKTSGIQVLQRTAAILRTLRDAPDGMSLGQIALKIGLPRSTVQRIVHALQVEGMVAWSSVNGGIVLGPEMRHFGAASRYDIVSECRLVMQEICEATGETVDLSVMRADGMILLDQAAGTYRLRTVTPIGEVFPLTTTANGRASLAQLATDQLRDILKRNSLPTRDAVQLLPEIAQIRASGLAYDLNDHTDGICAIGIGFTDRFGDIYSISVPIPRIRFEAKRASVETHLLKTLSTVTQLMRAGGKSPLDGIAGGG